MSRKPSYRAIAAMGRLEQARQSLLDLGGTKFGTVDEAVTTTVGAIDDLATLEDLLRGVLTASTWDELLSNRPESAPPQNGSHPES